MKKILSSLCFLLTLIISGCQCTLHTHYYNDYGVCGVCGHDIAQELIYENGAYSSNNSSIEQTETYYYKFTSHGENGIEFYLESADVTFDRIEIRAEGMLQTIAMRKDDSYKYFYYDSTLATNNTYYLKITYRSSGTVKLLVTSMN